MSLIEWNDSFSVGIQKIDEQHKHFFKICNLLFDAMQEGKDEETIDSVLIELQSYMSYHFHAEESWMKMYNYPAINKHKQLHEEAVIKINKFVVEYERNQDTVAIDLLRFLSGWLMNHILKDDRLYIPYLQDKI